MASTYGGLKSTSSIWRLALAASYLRQFGFDLLDDRRAADPPKLALNFTPFQFQGLWLEVIITPPAAPCFLTAKDIAGVGV